ncbi:MAG TPA: response regulator transcription factor [Micromonosporaceae bacterium]|nr:response regulator transcription factor [Micromonosporaceae bacterium]
MPLRVLLCDERPLVLDGLRSLLSREQDIDVVGTTGSGMHAIMLARQHLPQVVVTGLHLEHIAGVDLVRKLRKEDLDPAPRIIVFAVTDIDEALADVLHAGASGLLADDASREELALAIRAVARGQAMLGPRVAQRLMEWFREHDVHSKMKVAMPVAAALTPREKEILLLTAHGMSTEDIAEELFIGAATVRTHLYRLRCKLQLKDRAQLVSFAYRAGLVDQPGSHEVYPSSQRDVGRHTARRH